MSTLFPSPIFCDPRMSACWCQVACWSSVIRKDSLRPKIEKTAPRSKIRHHCNVQLCQATVSSSARQQSSLSSILLSQCSDAVSLAGTRLRSSRLCLCICLCFRIRFGHCLRFRFCSRLRPWFRCHGGQTDGKLSSCLHLRLLSYGILQLRLPSYCIPYSMCW